MRLAQVTSMESYSSLSAYRPVWRLLADKFYFGMACA